MKNRLGKADMQSASVMGTFNKFARRTASRMHCNNLSRDDEEFRDSGKRAARCGLRHFNAATSCFSPQRDENSFGGDQADREQV